MPITRQQYFNPKQIGGSVLWLDGADPAGTGTAPANGSSLTTWVDKSGAGRTLIVGSGTTTYANNAITLANSYMYVTSAVDLTNFSFFIIAKTNSATNNQTVFGARPNTATVYNSSDGFGFYMDFQTAIRFYGNSAGLSSFSATTSFPNIFSFISGSTVINGWLDGSPVSGATGLATRTTTAQGFAIGAEWSGSAYGNIVSTASIYEIIVYNQALSTQQQQQVEGYLAQKWTLTAYLPAGHPGLTSVFYRGVANTLTKSVYYTQFSPKSISNCQLWLDGADTSYMTIVSGSISQWNDKSGNGYSFVNNSTYTPWNYGSSYYPTITYSGLNNKNIVSFNTQSLGCADIFPSGNAQNFSMFLVGTSFMGRGEDGYGSGWSISFPDYLGSIVFVGSGAVGYTMTNGTGLLNYLEVTQGGTSVITTYNSGSLVQTQSPANNTLRSSTIGFQIGRRSGYYRNGYIAEVLVYSRVLSNPERQLVESYLSQKWALTAALPANNINNTFPAGSPVMLQTYITKVQTNIGYSLYLPGTPSINAPTNTGNLTTLSMTWTAPAVTGIYGTVSGYIVYILANGSVVGGTGIGTGGTQTLGNVLTASFTPMTTNIAYSYYVAATGPGGTGVASSTSAVTTYYETPGIPTVNTPTNTTSTLNMTWNAPSGTVTYYTVYVLAGGSLASTLTPGNVLTTTYSPMTSSVAYSFYVTATNTIVGATSGNSSTSATVTYTPALVLPSPPYWLAGGTATGTNAVLAYSGDRGVTWTNIPLGFSGTTYCVAYNGSNLFVMGGTFSSCLYTSSNGINWTANGQTLLTGVYSVVYAANISTWVAVGNGAANTIIYSTNGTTWNGAGSIMTTQVLGVAYNGTNLFVAIGYGGTYRIATSANGISWTGRTTTAFPTYGYGVSYSSNGTWIATGTGNPNVAYSTDGTTWSSTVHIASMTNGYGTAFLSNTYLVCGTSGGIFTSTDLSSWTQRVSGITAYAISANSNTAICASAGSTTTFSRSENATTWSSVPLSSASMFTNSVQGLCHVP